MKRTPNNALDAVGNKKIKIEVPSLNPMVFYPGFPHIAEKIFDQLDKGSLRSKVSGESDKFFVVIECCEHNQSENMDF